MKVKPFFLWLSILFITAVSCQSYHWDNNMRKVLVVHSYEEDFMQYHDYNLLLAREFKKYGLNVDMNVIYLNCEQLLPEVESQRMFSLLDSMSTWYPDMILVQDDQATYSLMDSNHPMIHEIPVVFSGVNYPNWKLLEKFDNVTGFYDTVAFVKNVEVVEELTGSPHCYIIMDSTYLDMQARKELNLQLLQQLNEYETASNLPLTQLDNPSLECILASAAEQGVIPYFELSPMRSRAEDRLTMSDFLWRYGHYGEKTCYLQTKRDYTVYGLGNICKRLNFTAINEAFGYDENLLGGYFSSMEVQLQYSVKRAVEIFQGAAPSDLPIVELPKDYYLDYNVMERNKMTVKDVPKRYHIVNATFTEMNPNLFFLLLAVVGAVIFVLCFYSIFSSLRVKEDHNQYREL